MTDAILFFSKLNGGYFREVTCYIFIFMYGVLLIVVTIKAHKQAPFCLQ